MDTTGPKQSPSRLARAGWWVFVLLACAHFTMLCYWRSPELLNLSSYAHYTERIPYQGRILMAWVLHVTAGSKLVEPILAKMIVHLRLPHALRDPYIFVLLLVGFVSMIVAVVAARASVFHLTKDRAFSSWVALLTLYMAHFNLLAVYGLVYVLPYDTTSLAFFSIAVYLVLTKRYWILLPVFLIGTLNRETLCFLTVFLVLYTWFQADRSRSRVEALKRIAPHVLLQTVLWIVVRIWLHHVFLHNPQDAMQDNGFFDLHLLQNCRSLLNPPQWPLLLSLFGFMLPLFFWGYQWIGDVALARSVAVLLGIWGVAMMLVGVIVEIRVFDELTAFLVPAIALILWNRWVRPASDTGQPVSSPL